jgi:hypothetical protein
MTPDLGTTNVFLGVIAAVSVLQALAVVGVFVAGFVIYRRTLHVLDGIEKRQVAPAVARVNDILADVKDVTSTVSKEAGHVDRLVDWLLDAIGRRRQSAREGRS